MLYFFYGLAGSGKTYVGQWFAREYNYHFEDADQWLTTEMQEAIRNSQPFTQAMRDHYFDIIVANIKLLQNRYPNLVISQACYKEKNRQQLRDAFPDIQFILIEVQKSVLVNRLLIRKSEATLEYANQITRQFEAPVGNVIRINNDIDHDDEYLRDQCRQVLSKWIPQNIADNESQTSMAMTMFGNPVFRTLSKSPFVSTKQMHTDHLANDVESTALSRSRRIAKVQ